MWMKALIIAGLLTAVVAGAIPLLSDNLGSDVTESLMTHTVRRGDLKVTVTENGMLESSQNEEIKCMVKGGTTVLWVIETGTFVEPGDELVRLDDALIIENITQQQITYERAVAQQIVAKGDVEVAETNIEEYLNGTYQEERNTMEKAIFDAEEIVKKKQLVFESAERMVSKGMFRSLQLDGERFAVDSARKDLELRKKQLETLELYKKKKMLQQLTSSLDAARANLAAQDAALKLEADRLKRDKEQLENCVIRAKTGGMVIFPSAAEWKETPDIEEGAVVREQQTLLMIPDLSKMQVKVGVHESKVGRLTIGMSARIELQDLIMEGSVEEIAEVTKPAGWWTGNMVKYDTIIRLEPEPGLKPGMSAVVDIVLAEHTDILKVPVAAVIGTEEGFFCWVSNGEKVEMRKVDLGDTNDEFTVVKAGLKEGDQVVLNPTAFIEDAQRQALRPSSVGNVPSDPDAGDANAGETKGSDGNGDRTTKSNQKQRNTKKPSASQSAGKQLVASGDKNKDGVLTIDEFEEKDKANFAKVDQDGNGKVTASEIDAAFQAAQNTAGE
ncbi:MAG: HlyD family efflux transporter periplasmic adaptor subunit [Planctomycetaceae bacterium]|nr:HlyD family efflux transporter periplasmic adaptor subunit [Planctomycetaceae bacterium]